MTKFILRRLVQAIPTFFGVTLLSYLIMVLAPGDPVSIMSFDPEMRQETRERLALALGVNDPWIVQYLRWLVGDDWMRWDSDGDGVADGSVIIPLDVNGDGIPEPPGERRGILRGDFGRSFEYFDNPLNLIMDFLPATLELNVMVLIVSITIGIPLGVLAAIRRGSIFDQIVRVMAVIGNAVPDFWMSFILLLVFGPPLLDLLPMGNRCPIESFREPCPPIYLRLHHMALPVFVLSLGAIAGYSRYMRASMLDTISSDYVRTARSKGLSSRAVWFKHALRNALIPIATFLGPTITGLLGGSVVVEQIFSWPGIGRFLLDSTISQDYPVIMALVVIGAVLTIMGYLLSDILYAVFDPRIRY
jgi:peptide/nickel transport system permease protein